MRRGWLAVFFAVSACSTQVPVKAFEKVQARVCACKDAACAGGLVADVHNLRNLGSEPEDAAKAKAALDAAVACAQALDPQITKKLEAAFAP